MPCEFINLVMIASCGTRKSRIHNPDPAQCGSRCKPPRSLMAIWRGARGTPNCSIAGEREGGHRVANRLVAGAERGGTDQGHATQVALVVNLSVSYAQFGTAAMSTHQLQPTEAPGPRCPGVRSPAPAARPPL